MDTKWEVLKINCLGSHTRVITLDTLNAYVGALHLDTYAWRRDAAKMEEVTALAQIAQSSFPKQSAVGVLAVYLLC